MAIALYTSLMADLHLIATTTACWDCHKQVVVPAFGATSFDVDLPAEVPPGEMVLLRYVEQLPEHAIAAARKLQPRYAVHHSLTAERDYHMTRCQCGAPRGDHYLFAPDGPFWPMGPAAARDIFLLDLGTVDDDAIAADPSVGGGGEVIVRHGTHCASIEELELAIKTLLWAHDDRSGGLST